MFEKLGEQLAAAGYTVYAPLAPEHGERDREHSTLADLTAEELIAYGNEAVLPFYLFHQTVILAVGFFVIGWNLGILPKLLIVSAISFPLTLGLYELLVRRFSTIRFFFGMKPKGKSPVAHVAVAGRTLR
jgi:hypothetical protein